jgi:hypothetical protein
VENLQVGLGRAEALTKAGELGEAVWAYLEVLEVDPDNRKAREQVGQVVTAVRQFDNAAPSRRWLKKMQRNARFHHWKANFLGEDWTAWLTWGFWFVAIVAAVVLGFVVGQSMRPVTPPGPQDTTPPAVQPEKPDKPDKPGKAHGAQSMTKFSSFCG